jgi:hypothetical protein
MKTIWITGDNLMKSTPRKILLGIFIIGLLLTFSLTIEARKEQVTKNKAEITLITGQKVVLENLRVLYPAGDWIGVSAGIFSGLHYRYSTTEIDSSEKGWAESYISFSEISSIDFHYNMGRELIEDFVTITKKDGSILSFKRFEHIGHSRKREYFIEKKIPPNETVKNKVYNWSFSAFPEDRKERVIWKVIGTGKTETGASKELGFLWKSEISKINFIK